MSLYKIVSWPAYWRGYTAVGDMTSFKDMVTHVRQAIRRNNITDRVQMLRVFGAALSRYRNTEVRIYSVRLVLPETENVTAEVLKDPAEVKQLAAFVPPESRVWLEKHGVDLQGFCTFDPRCYRGFRTPLFYILKNSYVMHDPRTFSNLSANLLSGIPLNHRHSREWIYQKSDDPEDERIITAPLYMTKEVAEVFARVHGSVIKAYDKRLEEGPEFRNIGHCYVFGLDSFGPVSKGSPTRSRTAMAYVVVETKLARENGCREIKDLSGDSDTAIALKDFQLMLDHFQIETSTIVNTIQIGNRGIVSPHTGSLPFKQIAKFIAEYIGRYNLGLTYYPRGDHDITVFGTKSPSVNERILSRVNVKPTQVTRQLLYLWGTVFRNKTPPLVFESEESPEHSFVHQVRVYLERRHVMGISTVLDDCTREDFERLFKLLRVVMWTPPRTVVARASKGAEHLQTGDWAAKESGESAELFRALLAATFSGVGKGEVNSGFFSREFTYRSEQKTIIEWVHEISYGLVEYYRARAEQAYKRGTNSDEVEFSDPEWMCLCHMVILEIAKRALLWHTALSTAAAEAKHETLGQGSPSRGSGDMVRSPEVDDGQVYFPVSIGGEYAGFVQLYYMETDSDVPITPTGRTDIGSGLRSFFSPDVFAVPIRPTHFDTTLKICPSSKLEQSDTIIRRGARRKITFETIGGGIGVQDALSEGNLAWAMRQIVKFIGRAFSGNHLAEDVRQYVQDIQKPSRLVLVRDEVGTIIGLGSAVILGSRYSLKKMLVDPEWAGCGIGSRLARKLTTEGREGGKNEFGYVYTNTKSIKRLCQHVTTGVHSSCIVDHDPITNTRRYRSGMADTKLFNQAKAQLMNDGIRFVVVFSEDGSRTRVSTENLEFDQPYAVLRYPFCINNKGDDLGLPLGYAAQLVGYVRTPWKITAAIYLNCAWGSVKRHPYRIVLLGGAVGAILLHWMISVNGDSEGICEPDAYENDDDDWAWEARELS